MRVVRLHRPGGLDRLVLSEEALPPDPAPDQIMVRILASSLNQHDHMVATGAIPVADRRIPLSDGAGVVIAAGDGAGFASGDAVMGTLFPGWAGGRIPVDAFRHVPGEGLDGFAREIVTAPASGYTRQPAGYTHAEAATLPCAALTAWKSLATGGMRSGDTVLVQGSGGVALFALQFAKAAGATVIAIASSAAKAERLRGLGADHILDYRAEPAWGDRARRLAGHGVDHVIEIGGAGTLDQSVAACRNGGHIALIGVLAGGSGPVSTARLMAKQIRLTGITVGSRDDQVDMIAAIEACGIRPVIDARFGLGVLPDAFRHLASQRHFGKIVIDHDPRAEET